MNIVRVRHAAMNPLASLITTCNLRGDRGCQLLIIPQGHFILAIWRPFLLWRAQYTNLCLLSLSPQGVLPSFSGPLISCIVGSSTLELHRLKDNPSWSCPTAFL